MIFTSELWMAVDFWAYSGYQIFVYSHRIMLSSYETFKLSRPYGRKLPEKSIIQKTSEILCCFAAKSICRRDLVIVSLESSRDGLSDCADDFFKNNWSKLAKMANQKKLCPSVRLCST